jgi:hypothetical protein
MTSIERATFGAAGDAATTLSLPRAELTAQASGGRKSPGFVDTPRCCERKGKAIGEIVQECGWRRLRRRKPPTGMLTPLGDTDRIRRRLKAAEAHYRIWISAQRE